MKELLHGQVVRERGNKIIQPGAYPKHNSFLAKCAEKVAIIADKLL